MASRSTCRTGSYEIAATVMKAAVFDRAGRPLQIESVADPTPGPREVVVRVDRCGICGSDLHITDGHGYTVPAGTVLGHEFAGEIVAIGPDVHHLGVGERVAAMPIIGCGSCRYCLSGTPAWCTSIVYTFGGYAEYAIASSVTAIPLPATLSSADAALAEPLAVALHGVAAAGLRPGGHVLIQGAGPIGLAALFWAKSLGAGRVDVVEGVPARANIALEMGADSVAAPNEHVPDSPTAADSAGAEVVVECVGRPGLLAQALQRVGAGGTVISLGYCFQPDALIPALACNKEARVLFPKLYSRREFEFAIDVLDRGAAAPRAMVTSTIGLQQLPQKFESLRRAPADCKVLIDPRAVCGGGS